MNFTKRLYTYWFQDHVELPKTLGLKDDVWFTILINVFNILDIATTYSGLNVGLIEGNPLVDNMLSCNLFREMAIFKLAIGFLCAGLLFYQFRYRPIRWTFMLMNIALFMFMIAVLNNSFWIFRSLLGW